MLEVPTTFSVGQYVSLPYWLAWDRYMYIYICTERDRERERARGLHLHS